MNKTAIKNFAQWAREKLIADITYKAGTLGITENGIAEKLPQSTEDLHFFDIGTKNYAALSGREISQRDALAAAVRNKERELNSYKKAFEYIAEQVAYTWFNRLIAIRFMEVNGYLPSGIRALSSENKAKQEPDFVTAPFETDLDFTPYERDRIIQLKDENKTDELFRMLFIKQCNKLNELLPELFEKTDDYTELLLTVSFTDKDGVVYRLTHDIDEDDFNVEKEGQVEIIGWLYQYYNTAPKQAVFDGLKKNIKITRENIPAATQLFTPDWIVRYMLENSLGRLWLESRPESRLRADWKYYIDEAVQTPEVSERLRILRSENAPSSPEDIKIIDPCMGSGHILVYAFELLMHIYSSEGYSQRYAAKLILEKNIFGLEIDRRAHQLAYFALMMKARQYNRRILTLGVRPQVYEPTGYADGMEYGSLVRIDELDPRPEKSEELTLFDMDYEEKLNAWSFRRLLSQKYDVVATNPPYMGSKGMNAKMAEYVKKNFSDSKSDLFAVFIERCGQLLRSCGYQAMITQHSWMFTVSYEKLRNKLLRRDIINMAHLGARAFEEIGGEVVQTTAFILNAAKTPGFSGTYVRLVDFDSQNGKETAFLSGKNRYIANADNFSKIPGSPVAYWVGERIINVFNKSKILSDYVSPKQGTSTGNNDVFLRYWSEVPYENICINHTIYDNDFSKRWYPATKGGNFRKYYGNNDYVIDWQNDGQRISFCSSSAIRNRSANFREALTWTGISSKTLGIRYNPIGFVFTVSGKSIIGDSMLLIYSLGYLSSKVSQYILEITSPTMSFEVGYICGLPLIIDSQKSDEITNTVRNNISLSRTDWDSFETSWDFTEHPLVRLSKDLWDATAVGASMSYYYGGHPKVGSPVELCYMLWQGECNERFKQLKANEEELNRIFIDIYGLQDELTPDVDDKDITVRKADLQRDIKSLISYAVGCVFGRYSLDTESIAYAGGDWDTVKYVKFIPDADNCIPITDEEYFENDIVGLLCAWLKKVYGEDSLEQNLDFIAKALGNKGAASREVIRNYFLNDFMADHIKMYKKRPIYWLFDSGKENGFKALCYMHRWNADTIGNMRVEYLHRMQRVYKNEIERMQETIDNSTNSREVSTAEKRKDKLTKQLKETKDYDTKVAHLALSRIDIDLDDGVKVNYEKVQTASDGKKMQILTKI